MDVPTHLLAVAGLLVFISLYLWRVIKTGINKNKGMFAPEPPGALPFIGHLLQLSNKIPLFRTLADMADKHGPIFIFRLGIHRMLVISNYEAVKECFTTNDIIFASRPKSTHGIHLGYNFAAFGFASYGPYWRSIRKLTMIELLSSRRLETLKHVQVSEIDTFIKDLFTIYKNNGCSPAKVVISEWIEHLTLNTITQMIAGKRYFESNIDGEIDEEAQRIGRLIKEFMLISGGFVISDLIPVPKWFDLQGNEKSMKRIGKEIDNLIGSWVEEHSRRRQEGTESNNKQDFIDVMLSLIEESSVHGFTRETIIKATVTTLIIAGADTTAINLTWVLSLLVNNKNTLKRAKEELDQIVGKQRWVEDSDIKNLVYLQAIVKETLRLYPPGPLGVPHEATEDCEVCGYQIQKGTRLMVNLWKLHRDPCVWDDPEAFFPERFLTSQTGIDASGQHFEFIPFGSGRRSCPGMGFALQVTHLTLARLLQGFEVETPLESPVDMTEGLGITMPRATELEVLVTPRLPLEFYQH
ncbi:hypothetical protein UlMin_031900 [Ulmus minor]